MSVTPDSLAASAQEAPAPDELRAWLQLLETPGLGRQGARRLLAAFGDPLAVLAAGQVGWRGVVEAAVVQALLAPSAELDALVNRTQHWLDQASDRHVLVLGDALYPAALLESPDPPLLLYAMGQLRLLQRPALAIVGSRHPTAQGKETALAFAKALGAAGITVVSGLAAGIDAAAHVGALDALDALDATAHSGASATSGRRATGAGSTIAVVGTGLDRIYPRGNRELALRIAGHGLLLSEFSLGTPPLAQNFPQRNRIIAGLSLGTLVVEAALQSGSLITARLASEAGREVFAVPGSIHAPQSRGCHALIKQGAKLVEEMADILAELRLAQASSADASSAGDGSAGPATAPVQLPLDDADDAVLVALGWSAATLDVLQLRTGLSASDLVVRLLTLELDGSVARLPGELFQRVVRA